MPPRGIPAAVRRELDARFQEQNELLERMMRRLEALDNQAPASPEPAEVAAAEDEAPAPGEPALGAQRQDPVRPEGPAVVAAVPQVGEPVYERFRRQKPPMFSGSPDPAEAEDWLKKIQRIFAYMGLEDHERVACATNQLEREALCWWEYVVLVEGENRINWQFFVESFQRQYLGEAQLSEKVQEFMYLKQGKMTVTEYVAKFNELARFAPFIVPTDEARKRKFMLGLKVDVAKQIDSGSHGPETYVDAVQQALRNESWDRGEPRMAPIREERAVVPADRSIASGTKRSFGVSTGSSRNSERRNFRAKRFNRRSSGYSGNQSMSRGSDNRARTSSGRNTPVSGRTQSILRPTTSRVNLPPQCPKCKRRHVGECRTGTGCYTCGQEGHYARNCPTQLNKMALPAPAPQGRPNARVYSLNEGDVTAGPSTSVSGQLSVSNLSLYALIDSGATHSYIASRLCDKLEGNTQIFSTPFITITPTRDAYQSTTWYKDVPIKVQEYVMYANLIVIDMTDYDVILGMDWLSTHHAVIDCRKKRVRF